MGRATKKLLANLNDKEATLDKIQIKTRNVNDLLDIPEGQQALLTT